METLSSALAKIQQDTAVALNWGPRWQTSVTVQPTARAKTFARVEPGLPFKEFKPGFFLGLWAVLFADKQRNYTIRLDKEGVLIRGCAFRWDDISETAIMTTTINRKPSFWRSNRRTYTDDYLILVPKQGEYEKFDLTYFSAFWGFNSELSRYIEFFKPKG